MPANILNLVAYTVINVTKNERDYHIGAEAKKPPACCPHCRSDNLVGFGRRDQMVRDMPMHGHRVGLRIDTRRYRCRACDKTFYEPLPEINEKRLMTQRLVDWIGKQAVKRTFASIADEVGIDEKTVRLVFNDYVNALEKTIRFETPQWMGIDEINLIKPRGVIANIANNTIVELLPNRNKDTVLRYLRHLEGKERIQYIAMDLWAPYRDACQAAIPDAKIVIDKFHVEKLANEAIEKARKGLRERLTLKQKRGLMHDRIVLLKRERDLKDSESLLLSGWTKNYDELGLAYRLKEDFFRIYDAQSSDEAQGHYLDWKSRITPEVAPAFADLVRAWDNWTPWILGYFDHPITNTYTESLNTLIRVMNRLGRGYSFEALRAKILFAEGAHRHKNFRPKFEQKEPVKIKVPNMRHFELVTAEQDAHPGLMTGVDFAEPLTVKPAPSTKFDPPEKNYGVSISTLAKMIADGAL